MNRNLIIRRCLTIAGVVLLAHVVAAYVSQLCFGAYAWHRGWLHEENWVRSFAGTPVHWFQGWIVPLSIWFARHLTEPSTFRRLDVISVTSYFSTFATVISLWCWRGRMRTRIRR